MSRQSVLSHRHNLPVEGSFQQKQAKGVGREKKKEKTLFLNQMEVEKVFKIKHEGVLHLQ